MSSIKRLVPLNAISLATNPANPKLGDFYLNTTTNNFRVYTATGWVEVGSGGGAAVHIGSNPPSTYTEGDLWFNNVDPHFYTYDGTYWVEISLGPVGPSGPGLPTGGTVGQVPAKSSTNDYETIWVTPYSSTNFASDFLSRTTDSLSEGANNKYFTSQRAIDATAAAVAAAITSANSYTDTRVTNLIDSAPGALDTLNEIAAAIGDNADFATSVYNEINATKASVLDTEIGIIMGAL